MDTTEIYILDKNNLVETAEKASNFDIQQLISVLFYAYEASIYVRIDPIFGRRDGHLRYLEVPYEVMTDALHEYLTTEDAWRGKDG